MGEQNARAGGVDVMAAESEGRIQRPPTLAK